jgi:tRNA(Ile)-lysidine synthetase-like protein
VVVACPGVTEIPGYRLICRRAEEIINDKTTFTLAVTGTVRVRPRQLGDTIRLSGGRKTLKKLFIDRKIPAHHRHRIPVLADDEGVLGVCGIGVNLDRVAPVWQIRFEKTESPFGHRSTEPKVDFCYF